MEDIRLRRPDRDQLLMEPVHLEGLLPADHEARAIWAVTGRLDLSGFMESIKSRGENAGRPTADPRLLLALWLYATKEGVGSGRELERRCQHHDAYRWLCGGVPVNYHTLNDFRVAHERALDALMTQVLTALVHQEVVTVNRISQDGTRVRASAGKKSFRRRNRLEMLREEMAMHIQTLKQQMAMPLPNAARQRREAEDRLARVEKALDTIKTLEGAKAAQKDKPSKRRLPRASTTDADARIMRMGDGGYRPAYNVQFAVDPASRAIVGVDVTNSGSDANESVGMRQQVERRTGGRVTEHLMDGGYVKLKAIERAESRGVRVYAPMPKPKRADVDPYAARSGDGPGVRQWRERMRSPEAKAIYRQRAATVETVNADVKAHRGLTQFRVRGLPRVRCVTLLVALTYNLMHFGRDLLG
jgi:transposase